MMPGCKLVFVHGLLIVGSLLVFCSRADALAAFGLSSHGNAASFESPDQAEPTSQSEKESAQSSKTSQETKNEPTLVGYPGVLEGVVVEGPLLQAKKIEDRKQPIILRILNTYPHGTHYRYDLEYIGLEAGKFNLAEYLVDQAGSSPADLEPIHVEIKSQLPPGQVLPNKLAAESTWFNSFYLAALLVGGGIWLLGFCAILFAGRYRTKFLAREHTKLTVADRLKPLVEKAIHGNLEVAEQAELERVLVAFWGKKLRLSHLSADDMRKRLRSHDEAGKLLGQIDHWLHMPENSGLTNFDEMLKPYESMGYEEINQ